MKRDELSSPIARVPRDGYLPLTFPLENLLAQKWHAPELRAKSLHICFSMSGPFDEDALEATLNELVRRHEAFRTRLLLVDGRPVMTIEPFVGHRMPLADLSNLPETERTGEALRILAEEAGRQYELDGGPLWRALLVRLGENERMFLLCLSHLVCDAWSMQLLTKETMILYGAYAAGKPSPLQDLPAQFADYASWQRRRLQGQALEDLKSYWRRQLDGLKLIPEVRLPIELPLPGEAGEQVIFAQHIFIPAELYEALKGLSRREGVTMFMLLMAAIVTLLRGYTGGDDFGIPVAVANRHRLETRSVVGDLADVLVLRVRLSGAETFSDLLRRMRDVTLEAFAHQDLPLSMLEGSTAEAWEAAEKYPSFKVNILAQNESRQELPGDAEATQKARLSVKSVQLTLPEARNTALAGITVVIHESNRGLNVNLNYERERYSAEAIKELLENFRAIFDSLIAEPGRRLTDFTVRYSPTH